MRLKLMLDNGFCILFVYAYVNHLFSIIKQIDKLSG